MGISELHKYNECVMITCEEAAWRYSIGVSSARNIAKEAGALKSTYGVMRIDSRLFEEYLEKCRIRKH